METNKERGRKMEVNVTAMRQKDGGIYQGLVTDQEVEQ